MTLSIVDSKDPITIGETTELSIRVRNQGEFEPVKGQIEIRFSEHLKPINILNAIEGTISDNTVLIPAVLLQPGKDVACAGPRARHDLLTIARALVTAATLKEAAAQKDQKELARKNRDGY